MSLSTISTDGDALVVAWSLAAPAEAVWAGFDDPALLEQWLGKPIDCDVKPGGTFVVDHGEGYISRSAVTEAKEPHWLVMTWKFPGEPESWISIEFTPSDTGTVLELVHHALGDLVDTYAPGWMTHLTFLEAAVAGVPIRMSQFWNLHATFSSLCTGHRMDARDGGAR